MSRKSLCILILSYIFTSLQGQDYSADPILPDTLYVALGNTIELYSDDVAFVRIGDTGKSFDWDCAVGVHDARRWRWTSNKTGEYLLTFRVDSGNNLIMESSSIVKVVPKVKTDNLKLLTIGNSLTDFGYTYQFEQITTDVDIPLIPVGTSDDEYPNEGRAGWTFNRFLGSASPFYFNGSIDLNAYIKTNRLPVPDIVRISLGINDCYLWDDMPFIYHQADQLIADVKTAFPNSLIIVAMPTLCENSGDGWINSFGSLDKYYPYQLRMRKLWKYLLQNYSGKNGSWNVQVSYDGLCIDRGRGYQKNNLGIHANGVHPNADGYRQLSRGFSNVLNYYIRYFRDYRVVDNELPSVPTGLRAIEVTTNSVYLKWYPSRDDTGIRGYKVFVNNILTDTAYQTDFRFNNLSADTEYSFFLKAVDLAGKESAGSEIITVNTGSITGIGDGYQLKNYGLTVFPNPVTGNFHIYGNGNIVGQAKVIIMSALGNRVYESDVQMTNTSGLFETEIRLPAHIERGIYFIVLETGSTKYITKVYIEH